MRPLTPIYERVPMVWFLIGLLFNAAGLYLGFEYALSFWYIMIGLFSCAYGVALFGFRLRERPRTSVDTRLSPNFISAGATQDVPTMSDGEHIPVPEQSGAE